MEELVEWRKLKAVLSTWWLPYIWISVVLPDSLPEPRLQFFFCSFNCVMLRQKLHATLGFVSVLACHVQVSISATAIHLFLFLICGLFVCAFFVNFPKSARDAVSASSIPRSSELSVNWFVILFLKIRYLTTVDHLVPSTKHYNNIKVTYLHCFTVLLMLIFLHQCL